MGFKRMAGWLGIAFVVLQAVGFILYGSAPGSDAPAGEITRYLADNENTLKLAAVLMSVAAIIAVPFIVGFLLPLFKSDRDNNEGYAWVVFGGFLLSGAVAIVGIGATLPLLLRGGAELDPATTRALWDFSNVTWGTGVLFNVVWAGAAAIAILKRGSMPRWFGIFTAIIAVTGFLGIPSFVSGSLFITGLIAYLLMVLWILVASVVMLRKQASA